MDGVNVLANNLRTVIRKDVPFIPGAWVEFWDSITVGEVKQAQAMQEKETKNIDDNLQLVIRQISGWNFTDGTNPLPITIATFEQFSSKMLQWFAEAEAEVLNAQQENKKKEPEPSSNS